MAQRRALVARALDGMAQRSVGTAERLLLFFTALRGQLRTDSLRAVGGWETLYARGNCGGGLRPICDRYRASGRVRG